MKLDELFGIDYSDPLDRHADYLVSNDERLVAQLVARREVVRLTQDQVAERMGIDKSGVSRIESGARDLRLSTLRRYAMAVEAVIEHDVTSFDDYEREVVGREQARVYLSGREVTKARSARRSVVSSGQKAIRYG